MIWFSFLFLYCLSSLEFFYNSSINSLISVSKITLFILVFWVHYVIIVSASCIVVVILVECGFFLSSGSLRSGIWCVSTGHSFEGKLRLEAPCKRVNRAPGGLDGRWAGSFCVGEPPNTGCRRSFLISCLVYLKEESLPGRLDAGFLHSGNLECRTARKSRQEDPAAWVCLDRLSCHAPSWAGGGRERDNLALRRDCSTVKQSPCFWSAAFLQTFRSSVSYGVKSWACGKVHLIGRLVRGN